MARNLQDCYCSFDAAERRAKQLEAQTGKPHLVYASAEGYWYPALDIVRDDPSGVDYRQATIGELYQLASYARYSVTQFNARQEIQRRRRANEDNQQ